MNTKEPEAAKLKALQEAACMGWADIAAGRLPMLPTANSKVSLHSWDSRRRLPSLPAARLSPGDSWDSQPSRHGQTRRTPIAVC